MSNPTLERLDAIQREYNPCGFRSINGVVHCNGQHNGYRPCCAGCPHLKSTGCSVISAACKFYFCKDSWAKLPALIQQEIKSLLQNYQGELRFRFDGYILSNKADLLGHIPYSLNKC